MRRECSGCGQVYHIPNFIFNNLKRQGKYPECPYCGSKLSVKAKPVGVDVSYASVQSHF